MSVRDSRGVQVGDHTTQTNLDASGVPPAQRVTGSGTVHNLPPACGVFVGRDLTALAALLHPDDDGEDSGGRDGGGGGLVVGQAAVHGLGGIGKTELVLHYARAAAARYRLIWWVTAENLALGLAALTARLHPMPTLADAQAWAVGWLQANTGWLLVLDNVERFEDIAPLLGQVTGRGRVIVTTRRDVGRARWTRLRLAPVRLDVLDRAASVELLTGLTGRPDRAAAARLAADLGDLPLALEQAAAYISQHDGLGFDGYRTLLAVRFAQVAADGGEGGATQRTVASVWQVGMEVIWRRSPLAGTVMAVLGWLGPEALPEDVLAPFAAHPADLGDALALLASCSMISRGDGRLGVHRLVQAVIRVSEPPDGVFGPAAGLLGAIYVITEALPADPATNVAGWPRWNELLPHIDALLAGAPVDHGRPAVIHIRDRAATYRQGQGEVGVAVDMFARVLAEQRSGFGDDHPATPIARNNLAMAYRAAGRTAEAVTMCREVLAERRAATGDDDLTTVAIRHNLARALATAGKSVEAVEVYREVLADHRRLLGEEHPDTLTTRSNLAAGLFDAGQAATAVEVFEEVFAIRCRVLGAEHLDTLTTRNNLVGAYVAVNRVAESVAGLEALLTDLRRVLGDDHPLTLLCRMNLAGSLAAAGRVADAVDGFEHVLADHLRVLGAEHPDVRVVRRCLAVLRNSR